MVGLPGRGQPTQRPGLVASWCILGKVNFSGWLEEGVHGEV